jgi:FkbM family methyltransferase
MRRVMSFRTNIVKLGAVAIKRLPLRPSFAALASAYLDAYNGDNNMDPEKNGESALAKDLAPKCNVIFDVGANVGQWSTRIACANPGAQIHAFEPSISTFLELKKNTECLRNQIEINNCGLGAMNSEETLITYSAASELASLHELAGTAFKPLGEPQRQVVTIVSLNDYCARRGIKSIDFAKIDVEGHEVRVLEGAKGLLNSGAIRYIQFEYHATWIYSNSHLHDVFELLRTAPYRVYKMLAPRRFLYVREYSQVLETHQYSNYLLVADSNDLPGDTVLREFAV